MNERTVFLIGNGLSLAYDADHYALPKITARVRDRLAGMAAADGTNLLQRLEEIAGRMSTDQRPQQVGSNFEDIAGPIDRLCGMFLELGPLHVFADNELESQLLALIGHRLRDLYKRVVGVVLEAVMDHAGLHGTWASVHAVAQELARAANRQGDLDVFVLNYDAILDAVLIDRQTMHPGYRLMDEFSGMATYPIPVLAPDGHVVNLACLGWRSDDWLPPEPRIRLHHLHGAGTWLRYGDEIFKAKSLDDMRHAAVFSAWAEGVEGSDADDQRVEPVVLLGDQKEGIVVRAPFAEAYESLALAIRGASRIVIAGYGMRDLPINQMIRRNRSHEAHVVVITGPYPEEHWVREALGMETWRKQPGQLRIDDRGLPVALIEPPHGEADR